MSVVDELEPAETPFELGIELRAASHELMQIATDHVVARRHAAGYRAISDSMTLDTIVSRLDDGNLSTTLARLFLDAAHELEAIR